MNIVEPAPFPVGTVAFLAFQRNFAVTTLWNVWITHHFNPSLPTFTHWNTYIVPNRGAKSKPTAPKSAAGHKVFTNAVLFVVCGAGTVQISFTKPAQGADFTDSVSVGHGAAAGQVAQVHAGIFDIRHNCGPELPPSF